jgi:hypothetical protein
MLCYQRLSCIARLRNSSMAAFRPEALPKTKTAQHRVGTENWTNPNANMYAKDS